MDPTDDDYFAVVTDGPLKGKVVYVDDTDGYDTAYVYGEGCDGAEVLCRNLSRIPTPANCDELIRKWFYGPLSALADRMRSN